MKDDLLDEHYVNKAKKPNDVILMLAVILLLLHLSLLGAPFLGVGILFWPLMAMLVVGSGVLYYHSIKWNREGMLIGGLAMVDAGIVFLLRFLFVEMSNHDLWVLFHLILWILVVGYSVMSILFIVKSVKSKKA